MNRVQTLLAHVEKLDDIQLVEFAIDVLDAFVESSVACQKAPGIVRTLLTKARELSGADVTACANGVVDLLAHRCGIDPALVRSLAVRGSSACQVPCSFASPKPSSLVDGHFAHVEELKATPYPIPPG
jgi:hypothetical protein